jgi:hypothetical protein
LLAFSKTRWFPSMMLCFALEVNSVFGARYSRFLTMVADLLSAAATHVLMINGGFIKAYLWSCRGGSDAESERGVCGVKNTDGGHEYIQRTCPRSFCGNGHAYQPSSIGP